MTKPPPQPKKCDKCGLVDRCKGKKFCRGCFQRMFGYDPDSKGARP